MCLYRVIENCQFDKMINYHIEDRRNEGDMQENVMSDSIHELTYYDRKNLFFLGAI